MNRRNLLTASTAVLAAASVTSLSAAIESPVLLTIRGQIGRSKRTVGAGTQEGANGFNYCFSEAEFLALPQSRIVTSTAWTPRCAFDGPRMTDVLAHVEGRGNKLLVQALNDYSVSIPCDDLARFGAILAHSADGRRMKRDRFGPLWVIYPRDQFPDELDGPIAVARFVWQVKTIEVQ